MLENTESHRKERKNAPRRIANMSAEERQRRNEKNTENNRRYREKNREKTRESTRRWVEKNKEKRNETFRKYQKKNREKINAKAREYHWKNRDKRITYISEWKKNNKEKIRQYRRDNLPKHAAYIMKRRAKTLQAVPIWFEQKAVESLYALAKKLTLETNIVYHVDHIVPLQSKFVCGLHCLANLQIMEARANAIKNNKWWPDMAIGA